MTQSTVGEVSFSKLLNAIQAISPSFVPSFNFPWLILSDKMLPKEEVESQQCSVTFPCYQQTIIQSPPALLSTSYRPCWGCRCRRGQTVAVLLTYETKPLFQCSSTLNLLLSQSITWQLMFQHKFPGFPHLIVFHTGLRWRSSPTLIVMKLPHIAHVHDNNILLFSLSWLM